MSSTSPSVDDLEEWRSTTHPSFEEALAQVDDARARGAISREEYLELLDEWWPTASLEALLEEEL